MERSDTGESDESARKKSLHKHLIHDVVNLRTDDDYRHDKAVGAVSIKPTDCNFSLISMTIDQLTGLAHHPKCRLGRRLAKSRRRYNFALMAVAAVVRLWRTVA